MVAAVAAAATLACTPRAGLGTVSYTRGAQEHVLDLGTCHERVRRAQRAGSANAVVSRDGRRHAAVRVSKGKQTIWVTTRGKGSPMMALTLPAWTLHGKNGSPGPIMLLGFWGDSRWLFYAIDPENSASLVADGVDVRAVALEQDGIRHLGPMLAYTDYRTWCGGRLVLTTGGDRIATHNKQLSVTVPPLWRLHRLAVAAHRAWGSLACAPDGRSVVAQSQRDTGVDMSSVLARWSLWRVGLDGSQRRLTSPPPGYSDDSPRFSRDGRTLFFVRSRKGVGKLYALRGGRVLGPLASLGSRVGYYGHTEWPYSVRP
jgi:WD40 repeat protein